MTIKNPMAKAIALVPVSICASYLAMSADVSLLAKMDSMSAAAFVQYQRTVYHHSFFHHFGILFAIGALYIVGVEFFAYVIALCVKKPQAQPDPPPIQ